MRPSAASLLLACLLSGCAVLPQGGPPPADTAQSSDDLIQARQLNALLTALLSVVSGTPAEQAEILAAARQGAEQARQGQGALRYGLLLAAPLHPGRDPVQAQQLLREALARPELLSQMEEALASVELERLNIELRAGTENQRLVDELRQERERQPAGPTSANLQRQLQAANEANALLRRQLDEARAKLEAIAELERQANRPPTSEGSAR
jgi:hypothetical protein